MFCVPSPPAVRSANNSTVCVWKATSASRHGAELGMPASCPFLDERRSILHRTGCDRLTPVRAGAGSLSLASNGTTCGCVGIFGGPGQFHARQVDIDGDFRAVRCPDPAVGKDHKGDDRQPDDYTGEDEGQAGVTAAGCVVTVGHGHPSRCLVPEKTVARPGGSGRVSHAPLTSDAVPLMFSR